MRHLKSTVQERKDSLVVEHHAEHPRLEREAVLLCLRRQNIARPIDVTRSDVEAAQDVVLV